MKVGCVTNVIFYKQLSTIFNCGKYDGQRDSLFNRIKNRPVSVVDLLGKGLSDNQIYRAVLTFFGGYRSMLQDIEI